MTSRNRGRNAEYMGGSVGFWLKKSVRYIENIIMIMGIIEKVIRILLGFTCS